MLVIFPIYIIEFSSISIKTGERVVIALRKLGYKPIPIEVDKNFIEWIKSNNNQVDVFFNALHGSWGEDGKIQGLLDYIGKPYTHSGVLASAISMNKNISRQIFVFNNLPVAKGKIIESRSLIKKDPLERPYVVKPISEG